MITHQKIDTKTSMFAKNILSRHTKTSFMACFFARVLFIYYIKHRNLIIVVHQKLYFFKDAKLVNSAGHDFLCRE